MADTYVAVDVETTGLSPKTDRIIEIGAVKVENGVVTDCFSQLINPKRHVGEFVEQLTGITDVMLRDAPPIGQVLPEFLDFCGAYPLVGHNILFDYGFLKRNVVNAGGSFERLGVDTLALIRVLMPELPKKSLSYVCRCLSIETGTSHRAKDDARAAANLYEYIKGKWTGEPDKLAPHPLIYQVKRETPATPRQKDYLRALVEYHKLEKSIFSETLTKNEASRLIDRILSEYGRPRLGKR